MRHTATIFFAEEIPVNQYVIVRDNCESFVAWGQTKEEALAKFHDAGYHDEWKVLLKTKRTFKQLSSVDR